MPTQAASYRSAFAFHPVHLASVVCLCVLFGVGHMAFGQPRAGLGFPPFTPVQNGGFDDVNLQSLNAGLVVPVVSHPGRGLGFHFGLSYNSLVWQPVNNGSTRKWSFTEGWTTAGPVGTYTSQKTVIPIGSCQETITDNFIYSDPGGTPHLFPLAIYSGCGAPPSVTTGYALDASGYFADLFAIIRAPDGTRVDFTTTNTIDGNGNLITQNPTITDQCLVSPS